MKQTITFELSPISVEIEVDETLSQEEMRKIGEEAVIQKLSEKFPYYKWSHVEGTVMKDEDVVCGRPVKFKSTGEIGIIYEIKPGTKFPVRILINGNKEMQCTKAAIEQISKKNKIDKLITGREEFARTGDEWYGARTAYFVNGKDIIPVVVNAGGRGNPKAYVVGHEATGSFYSLKPMSMRKLFDTLKEAEEHLKAFA